MQQEMMGLAAFTSHHLNITSHHITAHRITPLRLFKHHVFLCQEGTDGLLYDMSKMSLHRCNLDHIPSWKGGKDPNARSMFLISLFL